MSSTGTSSYNGIVAGRTWLLFPLVILLFGCHRTGVDDQSNEQASSTSPAGDPRPVIASPAGPPETPTLAVTTPVDAPPRSAPYGNRKAVVASPVGTWKICLGKIEGVRRDQDPGLYALREVRLNKDGTYATLDRGAPSHGKWTLTGNIFTIAPAQGGGPPPMILSADASQVSLNTWWSARSGSISMLIYKRVSK